jgi:toxin ParE1/3/4
VTVYRLSRAAESDIEEILRHTFKTYGRLQKNTYRDIIVTALKMIALEPRRAGSWDRDAVLPGLRAFHLELAAGRLGSASHCLYYEETHIPDGGSGVYVFRVLHQSMDPRLHVGGVV